MTSKKKAYLVKSQEAYDDLMEKLEDKCYLWRNGEKPTESKYNVFAHCSDSICIYLDDNKKIISYGGYSTFCQFHKYYSKDYDLIEYPGHGGLKVVGEADPVNHPSHYQIGGIETLDLIEEMLSQEEFIGYLKGNIIKYRERHPYKGKSDQDLEKAKFYWDMLQELEWKKEGEDVLSKMLKIGEKSIARSTADTFREWKFERSKMKEVEDEGGGR